MPQMIAALDEISLNFFFYLFILEKKGLAMYTYLCSKYVIYVHHKFALLSACLRWTPLISGHLRLILWVDIVYPCILLDPYLLKFKDLSYNINDLLARYPLYLFDYI